MAKAKKYFRIGQIRQIGASWSISLSREQMMDLGFKLGDYIKIIVEKA